MNRSRPHILSNGLAFSNCRRSVPVQWWWPTGGYLPWVKHKTMTMVFGKVGTSKTKKKKNKKNKKKRRNVRVRMLKPQSILSLPIHSLSTILSFRSVSLVFFNIYFNALTQFTNTAWFFFERQIYLRLRLVDSLYQ